MNQGEEEMGAGGDIHLFALKKQNLNGNTLNGEHFPKKRKFAENLFYISI